MGETQRSYHLDVLKFIAILLVCTYHFPWVGNHLFSPNISLLGVINRFFFGICSICIPLFFMVNGGLLLNKPFKVKKHLSRCTALLLQYYLWRGITLFAISLAVGVSLSQFSATEVINTIFFFGKLPGIDINHLWFIPVLIGIYWIYPFFQDAFATLESKKHRVSVFLLMASLFVVYFLPSSISTIIKVFSPNSQLTIGELGQFSPFVGLSGQMVFYFILGGLLEKNRDSVKKLSVFISILLVVIGAALLLTKWYIESTAIGDNWDSVFMAYGTTPTLLMTLGVYMMACKLPNGKIYERRWLSEPISILGDNTLSVYYLHWIFGFTVLPLIYPAVASMSGMMLNGVKAFLMVVVFSLIGFGIKKIPIVKYLLK